MAAEQGICLHEIPGQPAKRRRSDIRSDTITFDRSSRKKLNVKRPRLFSNEGFKQLPIKIFFWALALYSLGLFYINYFLKMEFLHSLKIKGVKTTMWTRL